MTHADPRGMIGVIALVLLLTWAVCWYMDTYDDKD